MDTQAVNPQKSVYAQELQAWVDKEKSAIELIGCIGSLLYGRSVELILFRNPLVDQSVSQILKLHAYTKQVIKKPIDIYTTTGLAKELLKMDLAPAKLDIGKLANEWLAERDSFNSKADFLQSKLGDFIGKEANIISPKDVVLYGFGRIGRLCARELVKQAGKGQQLRLRAIVTRKNGDNEITKRAALLRNDSVFGSFPGNVEEDLENKALIINGQIVKMIEASEPDKVDYTSYGINDALVIDNTGVWRDEESLGLHLKSKGVSRVILTAPGKNMPNIVYGVNHLNEDVEKQALWSAASCTTNAIVPILKVIEDNLGIERGHIESVHAYTNDQNLLDNMHKKHRRGRSAAINMVITQTGAAKAVSIVLPDLHGKLTANAVRVPTPNGSLAIMNLSVKKETTIEEVNELLKRAALEGPLIKQIQYSIEPELVSSDIIGSICPAVFDSPATIVSPDKKNIVLYTWYDNEFGYTKQVLRLAKYVAKVRRLIYY